MDLSYRLRDGRAFGYSEYGANDGTPVIALHGTPGSRLKYRGAHDDAVRLGVRLISIDRWGYGGTDPPPRRHFDRFAHDLAELADGLGLMTFHLVGISGGCPYAAMTAAALPDRVPRLALVAPVGPIRNEPDLPIARFHRFCFTLMPRVPGLTRAVFAIYRTVVTLSPDTSVALAAARAGPRDREILRDPAVRRGLAQAFRVGMARGLSGPVIDMQLFSAPWRPAGSQSAARVWIGTRDGNVPLAAARRLAQYLAAEIVELEGEGHFWFAHNYAEVLGWLTGPSK